MFTQSIPAVVDALNNVLPPAAIKSLIQSLGNCNQPLTHRGQVNIQPNANGNNRGVYSGNTWDPSAFKDILGQAGNGGFTDIPGFKAGDWNSVNYSGSQFFFPTDSYFNASNFYGGPTFNVGGPAQFETVNTTTLVTNDITTDTITGSDGISIQVNSQNFSGGNATTNGGNVTINNIGGGVGGEPFTPVGSPGIPLFPINMPWPAPPQQGGGGGFPSAPLSYVQAYIAIPKYKKLGQVKPVKETLTYLKDLSGSGGSISISATSTTKTFLTGVVVTGGGLTGSVSATSSVITYITAVGFNSTSCQVTSSTATTVIYQPTGITIGGSAGVTPISGTVRDISSLSASVTNIEITTTPDTMEVVTDVTGGGGRVLDGLILKPILKNKMVLIPRNN